MKVKTTFILLLVQFLYGNGNPYFQQMVKYEIDVTLNDSAHTLSAFERLEYTKIPQTHLSLFGFIYGQMLIKMIQQHLLNNKKKW
ncbi:MAG: hypothetical protein CM1200mP10_17590 [Candidatus Neomarinimicrobiota bacterium]|nr:MAG: hypothetical protein CM1200mP10_17590 [Candidatus Neomarinimicrobiota bacterium]